MDKGHIEHSQGMQSQSHHPKIPTQIDLSRKNVEDLIGAFIRQKYKGFGIEDYEITFKWPFEVEVRATIKRKGT